MRAVWLVRWHEIGGRLRFWTAIVGYDPRDRSVSQGIYLIYLIIFFSLWGFALLALLADLGADMLTMISKLTPMNASVILLATILFSKSFVHAFRSGIQSPFIFSPTDAELICQTPVDRRQVALAWFLESWLPGSLLYVALAIVLRYATMQLGEPGGFQWARLPAFILAGFETGCILLPLDMALMAPGDALGALRLRGGQENKWLRWMPIGGALALVIIVMRSLPIANIILWPVLFPLKAALGAGSWLYGIFVAVFFSITGLLVLYWASYQLNLSRAAQESQSRWVRQQVAWLGEAGINQEMKARQKLGIGHAVNRLPAKEGIFSLVWKDVVVSTRVPKFGAMMGWLGVFTSCIGLLLAPDSGTRLWAFIIGSLLVAQRCTGRLRADIAVWNLTRQMPFSAQAMLWAECGAPSLIAILLYWLACGVSSYLGFSPAIFLMLMVPVAILCIAFSAAFDILRHCQGSELLIGHVAELGAGGFLLGLAMAGLPVLLVSSLVSLVPAVGMALMFTLLGLALGSGGVYTIWRLAAMAYKNIR
jgi:hypothetical protein